MPIIDLTTGEAQQLFKSLCPQPHPTFDGLVVAQFIGRFIFICNLEIRGRYCYLTNVKNVRYWEAHENGLGGLADEGPSSGDKIDRWPDQTIPVDKLGPVMCANKDKW